MGADTMVVMAGGGPTMPRREKSWGTWEELLLGGAVVRHGTQDWNVVASELRARTHYPYCFTAEACKAKYEDLQKRFSGSTAWFEELRKCRMAELRRELEKSEDSIGSLELKLERLKAEKQNSLLDCGSRRGQSPMPVFKSECIETSGRETLKDELSAGSFTHDTRTNWLPRGEIPGFASAAYTETKPEYSESCELEKGLTIKNLSETNNEQGTFRKRRGKRKRKDCNKDAKEGSIGESDNLGSTNLVGPLPCKETSTGECGQTVRYSNIDSENGGLLLMGIFNSVAQNESALVFRRRLDSQKRARYKKIIRQHLDFDTIKSRISSCSIKSIRELFRDLILLANNALVFYSKRTREYKSALSLRDIVMKAYRQHSKDTPNVAASPVLFMSSLCNRPVKPRSVRPRLPKRKISPNLPSIGNSIAGTPHGHRTLSNDEFNLSLQSLLNAKKGLSRPGKIKRGTANSRPKITMKERRVREKQKCSS